MSEEKHTPGPWGWFGSTRTSMYLATVHGGRRFVMGFERMGMRGAQPTFQINSIMVPAKELAIYEVNREATSGKDPSVYRHDIVGFRSADACLIAAAPDLLTELKSVQQQCLFDDDDGQIGVSEDVTIPAEMFDRICAAINKAEGRS